MSPPYAQAPGADPQLDDESEASQDSDDERMCPCTSRAITALALVALSAVTVFAASILVVEFDVPGALPWHRNEAALGAALEMDPHLPLGAPKCVPGGSFQFTNISMSEPAAREAVERLIELTKSLLLECRPGVGLSVGLHPEAVLTGQENAGHSVAATWKYAADCESITYKLKVMPVGRSGWVGVVNHDLTNNQWRPLTEAYRPKVCSIHAGGTNQPNRVSDPDTDPDVRHAADFALAELEYQRRQRNCTAGLRLTLQKVEAASEQLTKDLHIAMRLSLNVMGFDGSFRPPTKAGVSVFFRYSVDPHRPPLQLIPALFEEGRFDICSDPSTWSAALASTNGTISKRRLLGLGEIEDPAAEATDRLVAQKHHFFRRRLLDSWVKPPVGFRHITSGDVPQEFDPRSDPGVAHCYSEIPVFEQGACGCCYASATAQMLTLRLCMADTKNHGGVVLRRLSGECADDPFWTDPADNPCNWYAVDPRERCSAEDVGQLTYCRATCLTCPHEPQGRVGSVSPRSTSGSPQQYIYSTQDLATCSCGNFDATNTNPVSNCRERTGCRGGNMNTIWDAWLRLTPRQLRQGQCDPLKIKCLESAGVTNPLEKLNSPFCERQKNLDMWDRSCPCIPAGQIPRKEPECAHEQDACSTLPRPSMVFQLMSGLHTLSPRETVMNVRRHIWEQGPVYAGFSVSRDFMDFYYDSPELVYPGDDSPDIGGHAVTVIGWGETTRAKPRGLSPGQPFWLYRNSWSSKWAEGGHARILAGQDVKGFESRMFATMLGSYADFSPPVCQWSRISFWPMMFIGGRLCRLQMKMELQCSEEATLQLLWADAGGITSKKDGKTVLYTHRTAPFRCPAGTPCSVDGIDLLASGFGFQEHTANVMIRAWDTSGLHSSFPTTFTVNPIQGAASIWAQGFCGEPGISCDGCSGEPTQDPNPASSASAKEQPSGSSVGILQRVVSFCFPLTASVRLADGRESAASELRVGDQLLDADGSASDFLLDFHASRVDRHSQFMRFLRVEHSRQQPGRPLLISANHLVFVEGNGRRTVPAGELQPGDRLLVRTVAGTSPGKPEGLSTVESVEEVTLSGYSAPLAAGGSLFVEDVLVSSYALLTDAQMDLWRRGPSFLRTHTQEICHALASPFRLAHGIAAAWARLAPASWAPKAEGGSPLVERYLWLLSNTFDVLSRWLA